MKKNVIKNKYDFVVIFDVESGKHDNDGNRGLILTDANTGCRVIDWADIVGMTRDYAELARDGAKGYEIYREDVHRAKLEKAYNTIVRKQGNRKTAQKTLPDRQLQKWMCRNFFDVRAFGTELTVGETPGGILAETVQFESAISVSSITSPQYALYRMEGMITAVLAEKTGFSNDDLEMIWQAMENIFNNEKMTLRKLIIFKHKSSTGSAQPRELFDRVRITHKAPAKDYSDYNIEIDKDNLPANIEIIERC